MTFVAVFLERTHVLGVPGVIDSLPAGARHILLYSFFTIGGVAFSPLFLIKAVLFLVALVAVSRLVKSIILGQLFRHLHIAESQKFALGRFVTYGIFFGGLFVGLQTLGVNLSTFLVFGGAVGVGIGLGLQNVVSNFVAGLILLIEQPIRLGDRIETKDTLGDVVRIAARSTWVKTNDNVVIIIPNNHFIENPVTNWTANDPTVRINIPVGVGYNSDPLEVRELLLQVARQHPDVMETPAPDVIFTDYGDNSINFALRVWTSKKAHSPLILKSDIYFSLFKLFGDHGIELPFPQRDLHLRSSDIALPFAPAEQRGSTPPPAPTAASPSPTSSPQP